MMTTSNSGILTTLSGRYAKALFDLAQEQGHISKVEEGLVALINLIETSELLSTTLENPTVQRHQQALVLCQICSEMGLTKTLAAFIKQLAMARRLSYLPEIHKIYHDLLTQSKGEQIIEVISAHPLTKTQQIALMTGLDKIKQGILKFSYITDPQILGGVKIRIGSELIDASLVNQLNQLATAMKGNAS